MCTPFEGVESADGDGCGGWSHSASGKASLEMDKEARTVETRMIPMTKRDRHKARSLLLQLQNQVRSHDMLMSTQAHDDTCLEADTQERKNAEVRHDVGWDDKAESGIREWIRELQVMLFLNLKGEMEGLDEHRGCGGTGVWGWVEERLEEVVGLCSGVDEG